MRQPRAGVLEPSPKPRRKARNVAFVERMGQTVNIADAPD